MHVHATPIALTIAGSDCSGGAGIQADLKTFAAFGVYGASVITALTAQNTRGVDAVLPTPPAFINDQVDAIAADLAVSAIKTGMLGTADAINAVCTRLPRFEAIPLIVDPVMISTSGATLLEPSAIEALRKRLMPRATLVTPNLHEAARLLDQSPAATLAEMEAQARALQGAFGVRNVLLKGGHGSGDDAVDLLLTGEGALPFALPRLDARNTHGTGCTLAAAIAALMATGVALTPAVGRAKQYVWSAIAAGRSLAIGSGSGPLDHLYDIKRHAPPA